MRNIKISFEHPAYIYPFKLNISAPSVHEIDRISCRSAEQSLQTFRKEIILSPEQEKILSSLSVFFKVEFVHQYNNKLNERRQFDYLGSTNEQHYNAFAKLCKERITVKEMLELNHYIKRLSIMKSPGEFSWEQWLNLAILFHTNFITGQKITADRDVVHQQLEAFVALYALVESINQVIVSDKSYSMPLRTMLPTIQDSIIQAYLTLSNLHLQEQALLIMLSLSRSMLAYLKERLTVDENNPEHIENALGKKVSPSLIFWIINFSPHPKQRSKFDLLFNSLNSHTLFELLTKILPKTINLAMIEDCLSFISTLFQEVSGFGELLFLITEAIRFELPKSLALLSTRIKIRELKSSQMIKYNLQCDLYELLGRSTIEPFKLKQMIKIQKSQEKVFNSTLRDVNKSVIALVEDFQRYKKGKIIFKRMKQVGNLYEEEIEEREILNIQKLAEQSHLHYKSQEILSMELFRQNEELIKVNRWMEDKLKKNEAVIAELLSINQKDNVRAKLRESPQVFHHRVEPSLQPTVRFSQIVQVFNGSNEKGETEKHFRRTESRELLEPRISRESRQEHNRKSLHLYTLPPNSENILLDIPKIDIPRERERKKSFGSLKQIQMSQTSLIFQEATNKINKSIQAQEKNAAEHQILALPPPLPAFMQLPPTMNILPPPPSMLLPPPPSMLSLNLPPPPQFLPLPTLQMPLPPTIPDLLGRPPKQGEKKIEMKNIGWNMLQTTKIKNSFWEKAAQPNLQLKRQQLINYFGKNEKQFVAAKPVVQQAKTILKPDRIKNVEIIMKKMKITSQLFPLIEDAFRSYNEEHLNQQFLVGILNLAPTSKEKGEYQEISFEEPNWSLADRFLAFLSRIDSLQEKINSLLFKQEFESIAVAFFSKVEEFVAYFQGLKEDRFFQVFLEFMLAVGNFLNEGTHRGNARAFRIENIEKTYLLLGQDKQTSLFDYILDQMFQRDPSLFEWPSLVNKSHNIVPLSVLFEDYNYFQKKIALVNQCIILTEEDPLDESAPYFLPFYLKAREDISLMKNQLEYASVIFKDVKEFYGDKLESEEMSKLVAEFRNRVAQWRGKSKSRRADKK